MRYLMFVKADERSEAGEMPTEKELTDMTAYNEKLVKAGVMLDGNGLAPSSDGARVTFGENNTPTVVDGPFAETKEQLLGLYMLECDSLDEAIEAARELRRVNKSAVYEIRPITRYLPGVAVESV